MKKKSGLGQKGVEVLLGATKSNQSSVEASDVNEINTSSIKISPYQPRASFDSKTIDSLAESIKSQGVIQPLLVRKISEKNYELIAGERRLRAAKKIGLKKLPAYVKDVSDETAALHALIENVQREDLNPIDEAMALNNIAEKFKLTHEKLSSITGKSRAHVTNTIRLLQLDEKIKKLVKNGAIEMGHARVLITLEKSNQINLANEIISKGLSVREAEKLVSLKKPTKKSKNTRKPDHISSLEGELSALIGAKVEILFDNKTHKGKLSIKYSSLEVLDGILEKLGYVKQ